MYSYKNSMECEPTDTKIVANNFFLSQAINYCSVWLAVGPETIIIRYTSQILDDAKSCGM